jgi:hypothetical protein
MNSFAVSGRLCILAALLGMGCETIIDPVFTPSREDVSGGFFYRAYGPGPQSALLLVGSVQVVVRDDSSLSGTWEIEWAPGADRSSAVGPQVGTGSVGGQYGSEHTLIDLNPGWADNNVFLVAYADGGDLTGAWYHSTLVGSVAGGRFELRRLGP